MAGSDKSQERRTRSLAMVKKLVASRTDMLSLFNKLAGKKPFKNEDEAIEILSEFSASLVDYTANAHFQLYRYFAENRERRSEVLEVADRIYPRIIDITQRILDFNDKYDSEEMRRAQIGQLEKDLSALGETLAERIDLEDQLIDIFSGSGSSRAA